MSSINYFKISKKCCGIKGLRLNTRRFSVQRLRTKFLYLVGLLRRWRNSCRRAVRVLRGERERKREKGHLVYGYGYGYGYGYVYSSSASYGHGIRTMTRSNSFCSEAIADCLEFIKRNSVSVDDDRKPMLKQE